LEYKGNQNKETLKVLFILTAFRIFVTITQPFINLKNRAMHNYNLSYFPKRALFLSLLLFIFCIASSSCSDSEKDEDQQFSFLVKVLNTQNEDITPAEEIQDLTLFFFDDNDNFFDKKTMSMADITAEALYSHYYKDQSHITIIGWGNIGANPTITIEEPKVGSPISDLNVKLIPSETITQSREFMLFHGIQKILPDTQYPTVIEMKKILGTLITAYSPINTENNENKYTCKISGLFTLDYKGEPIGEPIQYILPLNHFTDYNEKSEKTHLIPGIFQTELYKNEVLIEDYKNEPFQIIAGHETIAVFSVD